MLQRTQILLDRKIKKELDELAFLSGRSLSGIVRELLEKQIPQERKKYKVKVTPFGFLRKLVRNAASGPKNADYDRYAY